MSRIFTRDNIGAIYEQVADDVTGLIPISIPNTGVFTVLTNSGLGEFSTNEWLSLGISSLWDASSNAFDFSGLENGDTVDIRIDVTATSISANSLIDIDIDLGIGGTEFTLPVSPTLFYLTSGAKRIVQTVTIGMDNDNVRLRPARVRMASNDLLSVVVHGWMIRVIKRRL